jgi:hypothetical protein
MYFLLYLECSTSKSLAGETKVTERGRQRERRRRNAQSRFIGRNEATIGTRKIGIINFKI